ncbi:MAG: site-specific integrase [Clostridia bacterium]|nr:site-specific integrase [Clostridia bacterium]
MAAISKRSDGRWQAIVDLPPDPKTGKRRRKWIYGETRPEVKRAANQLEERIASGNFAEPSNVTVKGYLTQWLEDYCAHLEATTVSGYKRYIEKHVVPFLGHVKLQKLKPIDIQKFYNDEIENGYKGTTVLQIHRILSKAFKDAYKNDLIERNPMEKVDPPKTDDDFKPTIYNDKQFNKLLDSIAGTSDEIPVLLAGLLGLRRGEVFGLRWADVDLRQGIISIRKSLVPVNGELEHKQPKTKKSIRDISIPQGLIPLLKKHRKASMQILSQEKTVQNKGWQANCFVCCNKDGERINPGSYSRHFKELLKKYGLPHIRFHDLRHFNATMMLKYGIDVKVAAERLGHSTPNITQITYQHVLKDIDVEAADKLNKLLHR